MKYALYSGTDNLKHLEKWYTSNKLLENYKIIVLERDNDSMEGIIEENSFLRKYKQAFINLVGMEKIELSASYIRERINSGESISGMVPKEIENKVKELYK